MNELLEKYNKVIKSKLKGKFDIANEMSIPRLEKIIVNAGIGKEYKSNSKVVEEMQETIASITGQSPVVKMAKKDVANFKLRKNMPNGVMVTLRGEKMWDFIYKLVNVALPRVKDFRGVPNTSFDGRGGYTLGIKEHTIFPEIDTTKLSNIRSLQVVISTSGKNKEETKALLEELGMPFKKQRN